MFAAIVVVLAGIKTATVIVVPFLLALFIAIIFQPIIYWFRMKKLAHCGGDSGNFRIYFHCWFGLTGLIIQSLTEFTAKLPEYRVKLTESVLVT